jgi:hypothetical protein
LELGCLQTNGLCLLHLGSLRQLASLTLGGNISINAGSWHYLDQLHLPGVTQLSLTGCRFVARPAARGSPITTGGASSSKAAEAAAAAAVRPTGSSSSSSMDRLAGVLTSAFPSCRNLELGSCVTLSYDGLETLLLGLPQLRVLRLLGIKDFKLPDAASKDGSSSSSQDRRNGSAAAAGAGQVMSLVQQVGNTANGHATQQQQPYFVRLAERQKAHHHQQQQLLQGAARDEQPSRSAAAAAAVGGSATHDPPHVAAAAATAAQCAPAPVLQLRYLEVCDEQSPGDCVPQSALLAARQQSSSSSSSQGLPALADLLGAWHGVQGPARCKTLVFVNDGDSMVPLMK